MFRQIDVLACALKVQDRVFLREGSDPAEIFDIKYSDDGLVKVNAWVGNEPQWFVFRSADRLKVLSGE